VSSNANKDLGAARHNPLHTHQRIVTDAYAASSHIYNTSTHHKFQDVTLFGRQFKVRQEAKEIIEWIVGMHASEGLISQVFNKILRVGDAVSPTDEHGLCTPHSRRDDTGAGKNPHAVFLDIGANAGIYGLYAAAVGCYSVFFDVQKECLNWIGTSILENQFHHAKLVPYPVGNFSRNIHMNDSSNGCHGTFTMSKAGAKYYGEDKKVDTPLDTKMVRLDDVFHDAMAADTLPTIAMIKIDTEGFETGIIASMRNLVRHVQKHTGRATVRNIVTEVAPMRWKGLPDTPLSREEGAEVICDTLWDAGFQYVIAFIGWNQYTVVIETRQELEEHIQARWTSRHPQRDFLFTRTHVLVKGALQPDPEFQITQKMMGWVKYTHGSEELFEA